MPPGPAPGVSSQCLPPGATRLRRGPVMSHIEQIRVSREGWPGREPAGGADPGTPSRPASSPGKTLPLAQNHAGAKAQSLPHSESRTRASPRTARRATCTAAWVPAPAPPRPGCRVPGTQPARPRPRRARLSGMTTAEHPARAARHSPPPPTPVPFSEPRRSTRNQGRWGNLTTAPLLVTEGRPSPRPSTPPLPSPGSLRTQ